MAELPADLEQRLMAMLRDHADWVRRAIWTARRAGDAATVGELSAKLSELERAIAEKERGRKIGA